MSLRKGIAIALLTLVTGVSGVATAGTKHSKDAACTEHVKKMQGMKTAAERTAYCKADEQCTSHNCAKLVSLHPAKHKHASTTPKTATH